ncbi:hypothetical protein [Hymenobacter jeollabukensis]|uniref:T9SS type A sorting domain-containing protein n=1 Tax=Hymenobacter jeollabukensis TaxID=2025313 RepID=A0A5R8WJ54_9BACT|nr:hypothetical protein [Hymenobacter jeollabukensis]TLM88925.1 hypothetical protein FDY95_22340 [Hymenobacter jeollabukensis]
MKQRLTTLLTAGTQLLLVATAAAQVPNGDLESWETRDGAERPRHWVTTDDILQSAGQQPWNDVTKTPDKYAGNSAMRIQNTLIPGRGGEGGIVALGAVSLLPGWPPLDGQPYTGRPARLEFYYKQTGTNVAQDSATVLVALSRWVAGQRQAVAVGETYLLAAPTTYQREEVTLQYRPGFILAPDSAFIYILSASARACTPGNALFIDELQFVGGTATATRPEPAPAELSVFPNPSATGEFTLEWLAAGSLPAGARLVVTDALGRPVAQPALAATGRRYAIDLRPQPAGRYTLRLLLPDGRVVTRPLLKY